MSGVYSWIGPLLRRLPPETAHAAAVRALRFGLAPKPRIPASASLHVNLWDKTFPNPLGVAAGFDKNGEVASPLWRRGFGFVEVGTVTPRPQPGNPKPRVFRLTKDEAVINRLGFNSDGHAVVAQRLAKLPAIRPGVLGINIGKNKESEDAVADYVAGVKNFAALADYLVVNVSSPNTPGLRALQRKEALAELLATLRATGAALPRMPPLVLKIAPDMTDEELADVAEICLKESVSGIAISNTTVQRPGRLRSTARTETGGLSGKPLFALSTKVLAAMYKTVGKRLVLIGVGGVCSGEDAYEKILQGATLVQVYTGLIYRGLDLAADVAATLTSRLASDGYAYVQDAVGANVS